MQIWVDGRGRTPDQVDAVVRNKMFEMDKIALEFEKLELGKPIPLDNPPTAKRLSEIKAPALVIVGDLDQEDIVAAADFMVENLPDARKVVMAGTAHVPNMERPDEFNRHVRDFLATVPAT
jgi:pimeloyl-ACP methyl ester carboxylesterase